MWATHALYCVPECEIALALDKMLAALSTTGLGFIAHASQQSHYVRFHDLYLQGIGNEQAPPYSTGEQIIESLKTRVDDESLQCWSIQYEGTRELEDRETAERYLQRCLFDDSISLDEMLEDQYLGDYLRGCIDESRKIWRFPQKVWLICFGELAKSIGDYLRR